MKNHCLNRFLLPVALLAGCGDLEVVTLFDAAPETPIRIAGLSVPCGVSSPQDTLSGIDRCLLERWRPCSMTEEDSTTTLFAYTREGQLSFEERISGGFARRDYRYDGELLAEASQSSGGAEEQYEYDGDKLKFTDRSIFEPRQSEYFYDGERLSSVEHIIFRPQNLTFGYRDGRVAFVEQAISDPGRIEFTYDSAGYLVREDKQTESPGVRTFAYDVEGRLARESHWEPDGEVPVRTIQYRWDTTNRLTRIISETGVDEDALRTETRLHYCE